MDTHVLDALASGGFEEVVALHDARSGLRAFLAVHDTSAGPALGGIRRWSYRDEEEALRDVLRLARAMTHKCVLAGLPAGGAKLVVLERTEVDWAAAYRHVGRVVARMGGRFYTGPDVGTGARELGWVAERTEYVTRPDESGPGELPESTAAGVFHGMAAALEHLDGEVDWARRRVVVQGLGAVGSRLARSLVEAGATVLASDVNAATAQRVAGELELELVDPSRELDVECDVFAPCALGGILHSISVPRLRCRVVAGGANNVLAREAHGDDLHRRGVLYAPDFVINSGALIRGAHFHLEGRRLSVDEIGARIRGVLSELLEAAAAAGRPPARFAFVEAERRLEARRAAARDDA
ncbi:MAG: Glu/Leu/Phe/Val dehydrogenase [Planctomycetes bacterium]|nr:Glu/Leu/Phe/Val dehydrogenase [Planctomycetota bacterium]